MHQLTSHFILGYHGCDASVAESLLQNTPFDSSRNDYDWLGPGIYFWEANPKRGLEWANELQSRAKSGVRKPAVIGAVIDLGRCLDLLSQGAIDVVRAGYRSLKETSDLAGTPMPKNSGGPSLLMRHLDCAVIKRVHSLAGTDTFDTVRGVFTEGDPIYPGAGFDAKTHIQICVCNPACIKGVFRVPSAHLR